MPQRVPAEAVIIGSNLKALRKQAGLSQKKMGAMLGVTCQQVQKYENGRNRFPIEKLFTLKQRMNIPYDHFFAGLVLEEGRTEPVFLQSPIWEAVKNVKDIHLKRKIEKMLEIMLS